MTPLRLYLDIVAAGLGLATDAVIAALVIVAGLLILAAIKPYLPPSAPKS
jgi:uncharacterized membrane protein YhiD involved in acid resistance